MRILRSTAKEKPDASIICTTFNHQPYIEEALNSFLRQKTKYRYEIVVHDDASTDETQALLTDLYEKHSDKITLILQTENQFSKGNFKPMVYASGYANSEIILFCEGDDLWLSSNKLDLQLRLFQEHPYLDLSFHPAYSQLPNGQLELTNRFSDECHVFNASRIILGTGGFCPTASLMIRKSAINKMPLDLIQLMPCGDAFIQIYGAIRGGALFIPNIYSLYRVHSSSSLTVQIDNSSIERKVDFNNAFAGCYDIVRKDVSWKYSFALKKMARKYRKNKNKKLLRR